MIAWLLITQLIGNPLAVFSRSCVLDVFVFTPLSNGGHPMEHSVLGVSIQFEWIFYPVVLIGLAIVSWIFFALKKYKIAFITTSLQLLCAGSAVLLLL
ncbi:MAG: hypothetical protein WCK96_15625 [Methylococcales bacterium]